MEKNTTLSIRSSIPKLSSEYLFWISNFSLIKIEKISEMMLK